MQVDYIIIGQGICGTFLSYELQKAQQSFIVIDEVDTSSASRVASGVINPVTGRRIVKTWMIDELMPFAWDVYTAIGRVLGIDCVAEKNIIDCFVTPQMRLAFLDRYKNDPQYLSLPGDENDWLPFLSYDFGYGMVQPCYWVDLPLLLPAQRNALKQQQQLREEHFDITALQVTNDAVTYKDITARKIIFCDGVAGFNNPYFTHLPYAASKGEALLVEIPELPATHVIKKGYSLVPWSSSRHGKQAIFWLGSTYLWEFEDMHPTPGFYQFGNNWLRQTLKLPFTIVDHLAAVRPATLERRPFVGLHPVHTNIGILNGMGTKGCSLAPYFAQQLVGHILNGTAITPEADVQRFKRVLSR
jgi:glycine/D-amino acid oxidase-like deaminating enzyme